ncbi:hypothetical protein GYMLUDRAFT_84291 [Collybiopsis luxurians FD-317 M1]|uniref:Mediator of RNA polymerase II transcription subunit 21 n=1 Tax=Collybiopsis luxurians FD-317 M1 TaxID=944289 RepID=A0A0D0CTS5_9AGAR|nr:hypothetical protein GYMLUDRAFT_84291 [Collybiopsis luxurians FD-317 M1]
MSSQVPSSNSTSGVATRTDQAPPTLLRVTTTEQAILRRVVALLGPDITAPAVQGEAEELVRENITNLVSILQDNRIVIRFLREVIAEQREITARAEADLAKQKGITASMEAILAYMEEIQGI